MIFEKDLLEKIRSEFPRAASDANGRNRAFFDNGTGTLVVGKAAREEARARVDCSANVGAIFDESINAETTILEGRRAVGELLNAPPETIVSGESATSLFFSLSYAIGKELTGKENIVTTDYEHYANVSPWLELERRGLAKEVRFAHLNRYEGTLDIDHLGSLVDDGTKVVSVTAASNVLGTKTLLNKVGKIAKEAGAYFIVDAVHHISHGPIDVQTLDCDFLVFSGYKFFSSHGSFLYGREDHLRTLKPYRVAPSPDYPPYRWEWGTRDQSTFAAITGVVNYLTWLAQEVGHSYENLLTDYNGRVQSLKMAMDAIEKYERELSKVMLNGYQDLPGILDMPQTEVYGLTDSNRIEERDPTFAFKVRNMDDKKVVETLWTKYGIALRAENYYSRVPEVYDVPTMIRASLAHYNTIEELSVLLGALNKLADSD